MAPTLWERLDAVLKGLPGPDEPRWYRLTQAQQWLVAMETIEGQVTNGGFHSVYYNQCQQHLSLAAAGYEAIGAHSQATIIRQVLETMANDPWAGPPETWPDPNAPAPPRGAKDIGTFDDPWYALDLEALGHTKMKYVDGHPELFPPSGTE